jgi:hypothetical protein
LTWVKARSAAWCNLKSANDILPSGAGDALPVAAHHRQVFEMDHVRKKRNRLTPWYIGLAVIIAAVIFIADRMAAANCPAPAFIEYGVLLIIPVIYLVLMYLTLTSQE